MRDHLWCQASAEASQSTLDDGGGGGGDGLCAAASPSLISFPFALASLSLLFSTPRLIGHTLPLLLFLLLLRQQLPESLESG